MGLAMAQQSFDTDEHYPSPSLTDTSSDNIVYGPRQGVLPSYLT